ncbi:MAG: prohibitin family protein, partial [Myxococcales bacterium]|nr:prohibitin family protein [Myxococcales bacterium]
MLLSRRRRRSPRSSASLLALGVGLLLTAAGCGVTIAPGSAGLKYRALRTPALRTEILAPGYYPLWAWNRVIVYDTTTQDQMSEVHVLTADNLHIAATATVTYHPIRDKIYELHTEIGPKYYEELLGPAFVTLIRGEFSKHMHNDLAREASQIEAAVQVALQERFKERYIVIDQVAINHIDYDATVTAAISEKIAVKQRFEQKQHEMEIAQRDAEITRTQAQARGDAARIAAEGEAAATILRGKAQAEAQAAARGGRGARGDRRSSSAAAAAEPTAPRAPDARACGGRGAGAR